MIREREQTRRSLEQEERNLTLFKQQAANERDFLRHQTDMEVPMVQLPITWGVKETPTSGRTIPVEERLGREIATLGRPILRALSIGMDRTSRPNLRALSIEIDRTITAMAPVVVVEPHWLDEWVRRKYAKRLARLGQP